jgi:NADH dehydrogenase/NADH:ubiquinone oxidoreductase subunit G
VPSLNQQEGTVVSIDNKVLPTNVALDFNGYTLNDIANTLEVYKKNTVDYTKELNKNSGFKTLALVIAEQLALKKEQREAELLLDDATTRYQRFVIENSHLAGRIAAYHIASYLGITEVALSRIKRSLKS